MWDLQTIVYRNEQAAKAAQQQRAASTNREVLKLGKGMKVIPIERKQQDEK